MSKILEPPCSYQGGKQRLAKQIVDIFYEENDINNNTIFYDLCCGSGAISIEMVNRGFNPENIIMVDDGCFGSFWKAISDGSFCLDDFKNEIDKLPDIENIQGYLKDLSSKPINTKLSNYHYLLLQSGAFGSKQIWTDNIMWRNTSFRGYWKPTETSNRKSPVNPMMPMPDTLYSRVERILSRMKGIYVYNTDIYEVLYDMDTRLCNKNIIIYCDPPYLNTTGYKNSFDIYDFKDRIYNDVPFYISEGFEMERAKNTYLLSKGRSKGNISGNAEKKPVEEWLNKF